MLQSQWYKEELSKSDADVKHRSLSEEYSFLKLSKRAILNLYKRTVKKKLFPIRKGWGSCLKMH